jgi:hypothetical protein
LDNTTYDATVLTEQTFTIKGTVTLPSNVEQNGVSLTTKVNVKATAHVHTYAATWSSDADGHWYAATCTHTGAQNAYAAHSWNAGEVTKEATTTDEGVMTYTCTVCGREKTEAIPKVEVPKSGTINVLKEKEKDNFSGGGLSNQTEDVKSLVVTEEDQTALDEGKDVNVWLEVKDNENQTPQEDVQKIAEKLWDTAYQVGVYLDVTLWKQVGDNEATKVTKVTNGKIKVSLTVPENLKKTGRTYQILRIHDGVAAILQTVYDETNACLTFETDEFSTYALIYSDETEKITDDNKTGDLVQNPNSTDSDKTEKITENTNENVPDVTALSPKADDSEIFMHLYILLLIISSGIVALTFFQKRRKGQHDVQ